LIIKTKLCFFLKVYGYLCSKFMLNQSYSISDLLRLITFDDYKKYDGFGESREITLETITGISNVINADGYQISSITKIINVENEIFSLINVEDDFALRKINDTIKRLYKVKQADRNLIVKQIIVLLQAAIPMSIIKLDLKQFYESIDRNWILNKLKDDALLSVNAINILEQFFNLPDFNGFTGLPRGIGISATLSELYLRDFDRKVNRLDNVYFYARYVDDIILFTTESPKLVIEKIKQNGLLRQPLTFNDKKTKIFEVDNDTGVNIKELKFEYLGYKFVFTDSCKKSKSEFKDKEIVVTIASKKVKKYKTRIVFSFLDFLKNNDFELLEDRIKFLTGNYPIKMNPSEGTILYAGLYYNYPFINDENILIELTTFLRKLINSKNKNLGVKINAAFSSDQKEQLSKYSFLSGW